MRLQKGTRIEMSDGWRGTVDQVRAGTVISYSTGTSPNDYLRGCRAFDLRRHLADGRIKAIGSGVMVQWRGVAAKPSPVIDIEGERRTRERARIEATWDAATLH